jgi:CRISPR-associated endonuclease/helicase Cas3
MLTPDDFAAFFEEVYGHEPFPWQERLLRRVAKEGEWPDVLDLPTGSGKTAAIDIAVFHLAMEAKRKEARRAPVRIAFVVDRRLVVDDAFARAERLAEALANAQPDSIAARVAECLKHLSGDGPPLIARRLRGGIPREGDWARTPAQPTVLCSTVDQVGSRLLFRGYGVSHSMKPVHAGLLGSDCLILLDEAHLAAPFRQTLRWVYTYRGENWRAPHVHAAPSGVALLTATPGEDAASRFPLEPEDRAHPILKARLEAPKRARLVPPEKKRAALGADEPESEEETANEKDTGRRAAAIIIEVQEALTHFGNGQHGKLNPAIGIVVNRVARAREVHRLLCRDLAEKIAAEKLATPILMIGPARPFDRDALAETLEPIRTRAWKEGETRMLDKPLLLVATQCIEAGVDIDLDALITEVAPLDALRQRFGRLNRAGRKIEPYAAIVAGKADVSTRQDDPVYGKAIKAAWDYLVEAAKMNEGRFDFGIDAMERLMARAPIPAKALSPRASAPVLLPAHLDLLSQTSPIPAADPDIALYLHGPNRAPDSIIVIWRADIDPAVHRDDGDTSRLLMLVPPRSAEAIELPIWAVRRWLAEDEKVNERLADVAADGPEGEASPRGGRDVFRWKGDTEQSGWVEPSKICPGDTVVVPARYGGLDAFGWNPALNGRPTDVDIDIAQKAAEAFVRRRYAVRVAPGLLAERRDDETPEQRADRGRSRAEALADTLSANASAHWHEVRDALLALDLPKDLHDALRRFDHAKKKAKINFDLECYGEDDKRPRGVIFAAPFGLAGEGLEGSEQEDAQPNATEDDAAGSMFGIALSLAAHSRDVERKARLFAEIAGLPEDRVSDLALAGYLHDAGKADSRFQTWLYYGDPLGPDPDNQDEVLAKSGRFLPPHAREASGLPPNWRHEAFSVRLALAHARFGEAHDHELVLWLIGVHHGHGRPFFPHADEEDRKLRVLPATLNLPRELPPGCGPQSLAFDWNALDWPSLFVRLKARYGVWELARMEAILRLADHRASEDAAAREEEAK